MLAQGHYATAIVLLASLLVLGGCTKPEEIAKQRVASAWQARVAGDADAFAANLVPADREHVGKAHVVPDLSAYTGARREQMAKTFTIEFARAEPKGDTIEVAADVTWMPPGAMRPVPGSHTYVVVKSGDDWLLDLDLAERARVARKLVQSRAAIKAGNLTEAEKMLDGIDPETIPRSERSMVLDTYEATRASIENADVIAELRDLMQKHHETEDPAERANLVKKARELGIENLQLPPDVATLWKAAKSGNAQAEAVAQLAENIVVEGEGAKSDFGAQIVLEVRNDNDQAVGSFRFVIDLIDESGMRVHRVMHEWEGPLAPGASATTTVEVPSVPPTWEGALNVRLEGASLAR